MARISYPRVLDAGDAAFTVEFGELIDPRLQGAVHALDDVIARMHGAGALPGLIETMPTFRSLTVFFDPLTTTRARLIAALQPLFAASAHSAPADGRHWRLPVCYDARYGPDLEPTARASGLSADEVIALHSGATYLVYMLGFLPGFPFMGDLPAVLRLPRRAEPRLRVAAGSVAIATALTAIYPWESPGGWHLLGRCPVPLFDPARAAPALLAAGDRVRFEPVSVAEFERLARAVQGGELDSRHWLDPDQRPRAAASTA